jgi:hypothetical protein
MVVSEDGIDVIPWGSGGVKRQTRRKEESPCTTRIRKAILITMKTGFARSLTPYFVSF